jgi:hypothetical protein
MTARTATLAQMNRNRNIAAAEAHLARLTAALKTLKAHTQDMRDWEWTGDWEYMAGKLIELADTAERAAEIATA